MTEVKSLSSESGSLNLSDKAKIFLSPKYRRFMSAFEIGSNKLKFYGLPLVMAERSDLIASQLDTYTQSEEPFPLLTYGIVFENPMTLLWLYLNNTPSGTAEGEEDMPNVQALSLAELFQLYRLLGYFGIDIADSWGLPRFVAGVLEHKIDNPNEKDKAEIMKNKDTVVRIFNSFLPGGISRFSKLRANFPDIAKEFNYIPVIIATPFPGRQEIMALVKREILDNKSKFPEILSQDIGIKATKTADAYALMGFNPLLLTKWGPDEIVLTEQISTIPSGLLPPQSSII